MARAPQGKWIGISLGLTVCMLGARPASLTFRWELLPPVPNQHGLAGTFTGVSGGHLLVAGGAKFPAQMLWAGGKKKWHDTVFVLEQPGSCWPGTGRLPRPLAYGVSVSFQDAVVCVGGCDATRHYANASRLQLPGRQLLTTPLPSLLLPLAFTSTALVGTVLHLAGGSDTPGEQRAINRFFALDLGAAHPQWRELASVPDPSRLLAAAAGYDGAFYLFGGVALELNAENRIARVYLRDAWRYRPDRGWTRLADLPKPAAAAPSPAPVVGGCLLLLGGDDGSHSGCQPPDQHPGFPGTILTYDLAHDRWSEAGEVPAPRATAPCVNWLGGFVVPSGEVRPGVRSPEVWSLLPR